jgi:hypothetical protein
MPKRLKSKALSKWPTVDITTATLSTRLTVTTGDDIGYYYRFTINSSHSHDLHTSARILIINRTSALSAGLSAPIHLLHVLWGGSMVEKGELSPHY